MIYKHMSDHHTKGNYALKRHGKRENKLYNKCVRDRKSGKFKLFLYTERGYRVSKEQSSHKSVIYKLFNGVITDRITDTIDSNQFKNRLHRHSSLNKGENK